MCDGVRVAWWIDPPPVTMKAPPTTSHLLPRLHPFPPKKIKKNRPMCCSFQKAARERLVESTWLRLMQPPPSPAPSGSCALPRIPGSFPAPRGIH